ncbi:MAG: polysaccharide deacetylase family protein [Thermoleophilia bacterium]|nr:polysaccharide deacetylase family protein [Thermoleophilia bacterium]
MDSRNPTFAPPAGRPAARVESRARRRSRFARIVAADALIALLLAVCLLPAEFTGRLSQTLAVSIGGLPAIITPGTTLEQLVRAQGVGSRAGALVDVAGDVLAPSEGEPGVIEVDGAPADLGNPLYDGAVIVARRGRDVAEPVERKLTPIPHSITSEGKGPVLALARSGQPGERETFLGTKSKRAVAAFVVREPVDALLRRSGGLTAGQKAVALTFDDGPSDYTQGVLDALAAKGVSATFFVVGRTATGHPGMIARIRAAGHEVENHTWSHADLRKLDASGIQAEIARASQVIGDVSFLRPPYGSYNSLVVEQAGLQGLRLALWDVDTLDWKTRDAAKITAAVVSGAKPGAIILMHDGGGDRSQTVAALPGVIDWLLQQGYALTTLRALTGA